MPPSLRPLHLWLALSPHGFGHAAMTAPVIDALRRRIPDLRLTIQTAVPRAFLETRYGGDFEQVEEIADFGFRMLSATAVDLGRSAEGYRALHADLPAVIDREAERLRRAAPDLVLSNAAYVPLAAAARAGIPAAALLSLNWADLYRHYLGDRPEAATIQAQMAECYNQARLILRVTPAMDMPSLPRRVEIGPVARRGRARHGELACFGSERLGLVAFGGIDHDLNLEHWPRLPGWTWLCAGEPPAGRDDMVPWTAAGMEFSDLLASADVVVTKPGYGTFTEAGLCGTAVLYTLRPDWLESPALDHWLAAHTRALGVPAESLPGELESQLRTLFSLPIPQVAEPVGNEQAADHLMELWRLARGDCGCS